MWSYIQYTAIKFVFVSCNLIVQGQVVSIHQTDELLQNLSQVSRHNRITGQLISELMLLPPAIVSLILILVSY